MNKKWDKRFLSLAQFISTWSKDPSTKVGAVIVDKNRRIVSAGYNGFARKVKDSKRRYNNRNTKYLITLHAERNAIIFAKQDLSGTTIYTSAFMPCATCASMIIQAGIKRVVSPKETPKRWKKDCKLAKKMFKEAGIKLKLI